MYTTLLHVYHSPACVPRVHRVEPEEHFLTGIDDNGVSTSLIRLISVVK